MGAAYQGELAETFIERAILALPNVQNVAEIKVFKYGEDAPETPSVIQLYNIKRPGKSGATIILATVTPDDEAKWEQDNYFIKVNVRENVDDNKNRRSRLQNLQDNPQVGTVELANYTEYEGRIVEMTTAAFANVDALKDYIVDLTTLIQVRTDLTQAYLERLRDEVLISWAINLQTDYFTLDQILTQIFTQEKLGGESNKTISFRARYLMENLSDEPELKTSLQSKAGTVTLDNADQITFQDIRHMGEDRTETLINPIAYINQRKWEQDPERFTFISTFSHQDLHCDNIMCVLTGDINQLVDPRIIDLTDYKQRFPIFWDFLYLEFDLLLRIGEPQKKENRSGLRRLISTLMKPNFDEQPPFDDTILFTSLYRHIMVLRQGVIKLMNESQGSLEQHKKAFWVIAMSVGLNYMRKLSLPAHVRLMALYYAAHALQNLQPPQQGNTDQRFFTIPPWHMLEDVSSSPDLREHAQAVVTKSREKRALVLCLGEPYNLLTLNTLRRQLQMRLQDLGIYTEPETLTLSEILAKFRDSLSDLNLTAFVKRIYREAMYSDEYKADLQLIAELYKEHPHIHIITTDWHPLPWETSADMGRIHHICGMIDRQQPLSTTDQLPDKPPDYLHKLLQDAYVIFLGHQSVEHENWLNYFSDVTAGTFVDDEPPRQSLDYRIKLAPFDTSKFIEELRQQSPELPQSGHSNQDIRCDLADYIPKTVNQQDLIQEILYSQPQKWIVIDTPWNGKSTFVEMLIHQHIKSGTPAQPKRGLVIDFEKHPNLREKKIALLTLLMDYFNLALPPMDSQAPNSTQRLLEYIKDNLQPHYGSSIRDVICFDNLSYENNNIGDWLRRTLVGLLAEKRVQVIFTFRAFIDGAVAERHYADFATWDNYEIRQLKTIGIAHIKDIIKNYVLHVNWDEERRNHLTNDLEYWAYQQAGCYQELAHGKIKLIHELARQHLQSSLNKLQLGTWPSAEQRASIQQEVIFQTIWSLLKAELKMQPEVEPIYLHILALRTLTHDLVDQIIGVLRVNQMAIAPSATLIAQLRSKSYIRGDVRVESQRPAKPYLFVSQEIYPILMQHLFDEIVQYPSPEKSSLYLAYNTAYEYTLSRSKSIDNLNGKQDPHWICSTADTLFNIAVLNAIDDDHNAFVRRIDACEIDAPLIEAVIDNLATSNSLYQISVVSERIEQVIAYLKP